MMYTALIGLHVFACIFLIAVVLYKPAKALTWGPCSAAAQVKPSLAVPGPAIF